MAPDPPAFSIDESLSPSYDAAVAVPQNDDSDNDVEEPQAYDGYTLLGQHDHIGGPLNNDEDSEVESDDVIDEDAQNELSQTQGELSMAPNDTAGRTEFAALWNSAPVTPNNITIDDERSAQIKAAMAGFSLPPSAVPAWASDIPEELWKERLLGRLQQPSGNAEPTKQ